MKQYLDSIGPLVWSYFQNQHQGLSQPEILYVPSGVRGPEGCKDAKSGGRAYYDGGSYEYCGTDQKVYLGQDFLYALYQIDDAAPAAGLAHELYHHAQQVAGVPSPQTLQESIEYENQADCGSGAWFAYAHQRGQADMDDILDIRKYLVALGSAESTTRDHGNAEERRNAFYYGVRHGALGCNAYYPSTPLVVTR